MNHAAEAARLVEHVSNVPSFDQARDGIALAQVHATLALVEQQRAANLIAYGTAKYPGGLGFRRMSFMPGRTPEDDEPIRGEIERLIGCEPDGVVAAERRAENESMGRDFNAWRARSGPDSMREPIHMRSPEEER